MAAFAILAGKKLVSIAASAIGRRIVGGAILLKPTKRSGKSDGM